MPRNRQRRARIEISWVVAIFHLAGFAAMHHVRAGTLPTPARSRRCAVLHNHVGRHGRSPSARRSAFGPVYRRPHADRGLVRFANPVTPLSVRRATPSDLEALTRLEGAFPASDRMSRRALRRLISRPTAACLIGEDGIAAGTSRPVGAAIALFHGGRRAARLYSIAVAREASGRGAGRALLDAVETESRSRGFDRIRLEVRASNSRAVDLYAGAGYRQVGRKPGYYGDGEEALIMEKALTGARGNDMQSKDARCAVMRHE